MENRQKKLIIIGLLTLFSVVIILQIPESLAGTLLLPAFIGMMYSPEVKELSHPVVSEKILSLVILATPLIGLLLLMPAFSSFAYLGGVLAPVTIQSLLDKNKSIN